MLFAPTQHRNAARTSLLAGRSLYPRSLLFRGQLRQTKYMKHPTLHLRHHTLRCQLQEACFQPFARKRPPRTLHKGRHRQSSRRSPFTNSCGPSLPIVAAAPARRTTSGRANTVSGRGRRLGRFDFARRLDRVPILSSRPWTTTTPFRRGEQCLTPDVRM